MITSFHVVAHAAHTAAPAGNQTAGLLGCVGFIAFWVFIFRWKPGGKR